MAAADPRIHQIKIKTGVLKRSDKEMKMYKKEALQEEEKLEKMKTDGTDEYVVKKQGEILQESRMMIPDCKKRVITAHADLKNLLDAEEELKEAVEYQTALALVTEIKIDELDQ